MNQASGKNDWDLERADAQQKAMLLIAQALACQMDPDQLTSLVVAELENVFSPVAAHIVVRDAEGHTRITSGKRPAVTLEALDYWLLAQSHPGGSYELSIHDPTLDSRVRAMFPTATSCIKSVPIAVDSDITGIIWLAFEDAAWWTDRDWRFLKTASCHIAGGLGRTQRNEQDDSWNWYHTVFDNMPDPVIVANRDLVVQLYNFAAAQLFHETEDLAGQSLRESPGLSALAEMVLHVDPSMDKPQRTEISIHNATFSPHISPLMAENGTIQGWVLALRDISQFKRVAASLTDFLGTVSHDLRSPLTFMRGYVDMLGMVGDLNNRQKEFVKKVADGITQMADMVEKVLEAGKLDPITGDYQPIREPVDVVETVQQIVQEFEEATARKQLDLRWSAPANVPVMYLDGAMLKSALTNLVENAIKYTPEQGQIDIELKREPGQIVFSVTDNGYGIRSEDQAKLFQRNVRLHRKEWKRIKGSGLGLFIVKNVAQRHGGDAWVESEEGVGSSFYLAIPLSDENLVGAAERQLR